MGGTHGRLASLQSGLGISSYLLRLQVARAEDQAASLWVVHRSPGTEPRIVEVSVGTAFGPVWHPVPCEKVVQNADCWAPWVQQAWWRPGTWSGLSLTTLTHRSHPLRVLPEPRQALGAACCSPPLQTRCLGAGLVPLGVRRL